MYLKKYKIEKFVNEYPKSFLIAELLPIKEKEFVALVQKYNKLGFKIKLIKAKAAGGILKSVLQNNDVKTIFKGNLVLIFKPEQDINFINYLKDLKILFLFLYHKGLFYHIDQINKITPNQNIISTLENPYMNLIQNNNRNIISIIQMIELSTQKKINPVTK
jgi:hypothetical protein